MLALPFLLGTCLPLPWSPPLSPHALVLISLSHQGAALAHFDSLPLTICYFGLTALFLFFLAKAALAYLPTALSVALRPLSFSADPVCSRFSAEACAILQVFCWSRQHQQVCNFFSLLLLSDSRHPIFSFIFSSTSNSVADLAETVFSLLLFYQAKMGPRTLFFP